MKHAMRRVVNVTPVAFTSYDLFLVPNLDWVDPGSQASFPTEQKFGDLTRWEDVQYYE